MQRAYFDACVAIYYVERNSMLFPKVIAAMFPAGGESTCPVVSDLTKLECRVYPLRRGDRSLLERYDSFFAHPEVGYAVIDRTVFELATTLRAEHGLKTPDAIHLAAAITGGCNEFWTNDGRLAKAASGRIRIIVFNQME